MTTISKTRRKSKNKVLWLAIFSFVATTVLLLRFGKISQKSFDGNERSSFFTLWSQKSSSKGTKKSSLGEGKYGILQTNKINVEYIYEFNSQKDVRDIEGLIFLAHGCGHSAKDWWPVSNSCPLCVGLPIERRIVSEVLENHHWLAVAISSSRSCWRVVDVDNVVAVINHIQNTVLKGNKNKNIPVYALGVSSGGKFVSELSLSDKIDISAVVVQIMPARLVNAKHPPIAYNHMPRDEYTADIIRDQIKAFLALKSDTGSPVVDVMEIRSMPRVITRTYFYDYIPEKVTKSQSSEIFEGLLKEGFLDKSFRLKDDPRESSWRSVVQSIIPKRDDSLIPDNSPISELMNLAWARHEITDYGISESIDFLARYKNIH